MSELREQLTPLCRQMQIIVGAMLLGTLVFGVVVMVIGGQGPQDPAPIQGEEVERRGDELIGTIAMFFGLAAVVMQQALGRLLADKTAKQLAARSADPVESLGGAYMTGLIVSCAICEGAAFFNLIAYMLFQGWPNLAMAGLLALVIATKLPTVGRVAAWVEARQRDLADEAALDG